VQPISVEAEGTDVTSVNVYSNATHVYSKSLLCYFANITGLYVLALQVYTVAR